MLLFSKKTAQRESPALPQPETRAARALQQQSPIKIKIKIEIEIKIHESQQLLKSPALVRCGSLGVFAVQEFEDPL